MTTGELVAGAELLVAAELLAEVEGAAALAVVVAEGVELVVGGADAEGLPEEAATPAPEC